MSNRQKTENPTGAGKKPTLRVAFDSRLKLEFHGSKVTSDAGLLAYRELDAALGPTDLGDDMLNDWRKGKNTQHSMVALMRQSIFSRLAGWTLTTLREKLIKIGAKVVRHSRKIVFQMAEVAVPRELFQTILERIGRLRLPAASSG
jgi:hypothetical protein